MITSEIKTFQGTGDTANVAKAELYKNIMLYFNEVMTELGFERIDTNGNHEIIDGTTTYFGLNEYWKIPNSENDYALTISLKSTGSGLNSIYVYFSINSTNNIFEDVNATSSGAANSGVPTPVGYSSYTITGKSSSSNGVYLATAEVYITKLNNAYTILFGIGKTPSLARSFGMIKINDIWREYTFSGTVITTLSNNAIRYSGISLFSSKEVLDFTDNIMLVPMYLYSDSSYDSIYSSLCLDGFYECPKNIITQNSKYSINGEMYMALSSQLLVKI